MGKDLSGRERYARLMKRMSVGQLQRFPPTPQSRSLTGRTTRAMRDHPIEPNALMASKARGGEFKTSKSSAHDDLFLIAER